MCVCVFCFLQDLGPCWARLLREAIQDEDLELVKELEGHKYEMGAMAIRRAMILAQGRGKPEIKQELAKWLRLVVRHERQQALLR